VQIYRANPRLHRFYGQHPNRLWTRVATRPNQIWVGDITYVPVVGRWRFLAVVLDQYSRRVLAWMLGRTRDAHLTRAVLDAAVRRRRPRAGLVFHSDRGSEYAAQAFRDRLRALGIRQSATRVGTPGDNAHMESFFHSLKAELVHGARFATERRLRLALRAIFAITITGGCTPPWAIVPQSTMSRELPNNGCLRVRGKIPGGDRSNGSGVLCPGGHELSFNCTALGGRVARSLSAIR